MAIHVIYSIYKKDETKKTDFYELYDIITHTDPYWSETLLINGGIIEKLKEKYKESDGYMIKVSSATSGSGNNE